MISRVSLLQHLPANSSLVLRISHSSASAIYQISDLYLQQHLRVTNAVLRLGSQSLTLVSDQVQVIFSLFSFVCIWSETVSDTLSRRTEVVQT